ncbi:hypothetical protein FXO37_18182 [Capsicum annuum]|nr:hypothetical protein FXO37_18182 [Capsicum annuum]
MGQRMLRFDFVSWDPPQVGFESCVMGDYPARFEEHFYPALVNGSPSIKQEGSISSHGGVTIDSIYYYGKSMYQDVNLRSYFGLIHPPTRLTFWTSSRPIKKEGRWKAFGKVSPIECLHSSDGTEEEQNKGDSTSQLDLVVEPVGIMHAGMWEFEDRLGRRDFAKGGLSVREEGIFPLSFHFLTRFALQGREGIRASIKNLSSSYGHKEIRNCTISRVDRGPDLDVEKISQPEAEKKAYDSIGVKLFKAYWLSCLCGTSKAKPRLCTEKDHWSTIPILDVPKDDEPNPAGRTLLTGLELEWDRPKSSLPIR